MAREPSFRPPSMMARQAQSRVRDAYEEERKANPKLKPYRDLTKAEQKQLFERIQPPFHVNNFVLGNSLRGNHR